jgi:Flp pilus assembly protein TadB
VTGWALLSAAAATGLGLSGGGAALARLRLRAGMAAPVAASRAPERLRLPTLAALAVTGTAVLVLGVGAGLLVGLPAGAMAARGALRRTDPATREQQRRLSADLPLFCDLVAAQVAAGASLPLAAEAAAEAVAGELADAVRSAIAVIRLGTAPEEAWAALGGAREPLRPLSRLLARASATGSGVAEALTTLAEEARVRQRVSVEAAARRSEALAVAPLGLCFLPAFVLVGVLPLVAGLVAGVLGGLVPGHG